MTMGEDQHGSNLVHAANAFTTECFPSGKGWQGGKGRVEKSDPSAERSPSSCPQKRSRVEDDITSSELDDVKVVWSCLGE